METSRSIAGDGLRTMPSLLRFRTIACVTLLMLPACVARLADRNSPKENGGVTGEPANCSAIEVLPRGAPVGDAAPKLVGRFAYPPETPGEALFDWSGNYVTVRFQGTSRLTVKLRLPGPVPQDQVFTFAVDNLPPTTRLITVKNDAAGKPTLEPEENYDIVNLDPSTPHEVTVYKNTEAQKGGVIFKGFELNGGTLLPPTRRPRRIEFIGDSIICGYGNEGKNATCPFETKIREVTVPATDTQRQRTVPIAVPLTENQFLSFTSIAARELDADAVTLCWSGKGAYKNYKERFKTNPDDPTKFLYKSADQSPGNRVPEDDATTTMPQLWETRTVASDFQGFKWDFVQEKPDEIPQVVFISLGTNDFSRDTKEAAPNPSKLEGDNLPDGDMINPAERESFFAAYLALVKKVREHRPDAHIFLGTPPMVTDQFPIDNARRYIRDILRRIVAEQGRVGDRKVYQMDLVEQGFRYGLGCDYHPNLEVHRIMAKQLVGAVRSKTCW
jgi:lysophospholipase L1-like esterase